MDCPSAREPSAAKQRTVPADVRSERHAEKSNQEDAGERAEAKAAGEVEAPLWLRRSDQLFVGVMVAAILVLMVVQWIRIGGWGRELVEIDHAPQNRYQFRLDVNKATWIEWAQLEGIGPKLAQRIVEDREKNGPFRSIDDVQRVKGIGPVKLERIRRYLTISSPPGTQDSESSPPAAR